MRDSEVFIGVFPGVAIMDANDLPVFGKMEIALDGVGSLLPGKLEGGEGVLRGVGRGSAATMAGFCACAVRQSSNSIMSGLVVALISG